MNRIVGTRIGWGAELEDCVYKKVLPNRLLSTNHGTQLHIRNKAPLLALGGIKQINSMCLTAHTDANTPQKKLGGDISEVPTCIPNLRDSGAGWQQLLQILSFVPRKLGFGAVKPASPKVSSPKSTPKQNEGSISERLNDGLTPRKLLLVPLSSSKQYIKKKMV